MDNTNSPMGDPLNESPQNLLLRIAHLTRTLRDSMRELGLDQAIKEAAHAIPDARDRLHYVARMTEQAANRVLNAAERMQPWQEGMQESAKNLSRRWDSWFEEPKELAEARELVDDTRAFLGEVPEHTRQSLETIMEIIMAQDFQDLTGQVIMKMLGVITAIETELVQVLIENLPQEQKTVAESLLNGPQVSQEPSQEIVADQDQVDDLLASLGL